MSEKNEATADAVEARESELELVDEESCFLGFYKEADSVIMTCSITVRNLTSQDKHFYIQGISEEDMDHSLLALPELVAVDKKIGDERLSTYQQLQWLAENVDEWWDTSWQFNDFAALGDINGNGQIEIIRDIGSGIVRKIYTEVQEVDSEFQLAWIGMISLGSQEENSIEGMSGEELEQAKKSLATAGGKTLYDIIGQDGNKEFSELSRKKRYKILVKMWESYLEQKEQ